MLIALLATSAAAVLLGGCGHSGGGLGGGLANGGLGLFKKKPPEVQMTAAEAFEATTKWNDAYNKDPTNARNALGYSAALRALGNKKRAFEVLQTAYAANPNNPELAAEIGKVALETGQVSVATKALQTAEEKGVKDWKTLSAQGTLAAKSGDHAKAQQYYQAALRQKPDSTSVINNLALSYALDGKAKQAEALLRKAEKEGHSDKRLRQNLALVLGVQGKYNEAKDVAAVDVGETQAKRSVAYLKNMLSKPTTVAAAEPEAPAQSDQGWSPFGSTAPSKTAAPAVAAASHQQARPLPTVQMVKPVEEVISAPPKVAQASSPGTSTFSKSSSR
ncbi:tetratricopeptide repeat protein [Methyloceanibacter caenitepidi]|uniref:Flp pilus assembly protein TadD, contains TPR repeat n=1 Tax=Methyloceanibacter caenitepidi TaxID=1384459 RepID=A0A0A8K017_9HYPH|nr:tetratricopeptide repeat protein [Methyloceanibacter caenitepidi]BAQ16205.1 Flp pilus assembly protein TadD, contains TPR repeat [Methyloceanibacter caenitepidi]